MGFLNGLSSFASSPQGLGIGAIASPALIGATALSAGTDIFNSYMSYKNYKVQKSNLNWQKDVQNTMWTRDDNAVQRRTQDLIAAGLSPTLAAGSAAEAGPVVNTIAPQMAPIQNNTMNLANAMALISMDKEFQKKDQEIALMKSQTRGNNINNDFAEKHNIPLNANSNLQTGAVTADGIQALERKIIGGAKAAEKAIDKTVQSGKKAVIDSASKNGAALGDYYPNY